MSNYTENVRFRELLIRYKKNKTQKDYNEIGKIFLLISNNFLNKSSFIKYTQDRKDEIVSDAVYLMCKYIDKYDTEKYNPFAYFTQVVKNATFLYINNRKKHDNNFKSIEYIDHIDQNEMSDMWGNG